MGLGDAILGALFGVAGVSANTFQPPCVLGDESIMSKKAHGTSAVPVQDNLRWNCDGKTADRICNFNRHYAEHSGYWETTTFLKEMGGDGSGGGGPSQPIQFFDSNTGKLLFEAPKGRTWEEFVRESRAHGWPSFRDQEVEWNNVRVLPNGEAVSVDGT